MRGPDELWDKFIGLEEDIRNFSSKRYVDLIVGCVAFLSDQK